MSKFQNQSSIVQQLYTSRKNILDYLKKLNYDTSVYETFTLAEISAMKQATKDVDDTSCLDFEVNKINNENEKCKIIYYLKNSTIKKNSLESLVWDYFENFEDKSNGKLIIIIQSNINDTIQSTIQNIWKKYNEYVVIFEMKTLLFNILEHSYVPKHIKLTSQEKIELYEKMNIKDDSQLPEISVFDPVAKAILMVPGEVCKIERYDIISFNNDFYRICVI